jgi:phosphoribosylformylglycinamidine synthase
VVSSKVFTVKVVVSNKESARDPEGETIFRDLVSKSNYGQVKSIRSGKFLRFEVLADDPRSARTLVEKMCDDLRIYNPAVHSITVES